MLMSLLLDLTLLCFFIMENKCFGQSLVATGCNSRALLNTEIWFGRTVQPIVHSAHQKLSLWQRLLFRLLLLLLLGTVHSNPGLTLYASSHSGAIALSTNYQPSIKTSLHRCQPLPTLADRHCLLHAVSASIRNYLGMHVNLKNVTNYACTELIHNFDLYSSFISASHSQYNKLLNRYFILKHWNYSLANLVPLAFANAFTVYILSKFI